MSMPSPRPLRRPPLARWRAAWPLVCLAAALAVALPLETALREARLRRLAPAAHATEGQPLWVQYVMIGLGGFRGVVAEALWMRAGRLQEQGRYFEQVQLADWITALDPRATDAWVFNSWNLAYNISAMMPRHEDRITWVQAGVALLRDRAIPANPADARLYRELGWLYQNKIGDAMDPAHQHYKLALALEMAPMLGPGGAPPAAGSRDAERLLHEYRLDSTLMHTIGEKLAPLDWRLPESHGIYWAAAGLPHASGFEHQALRRMIHQNLFALIERGSFTGDLAAGRYTTAPNLALIPATTRFLRETVRLYDNETSLMARFLAIAILRQSESGDTEGARASYRELQKLAGDRYTIPEFSVLTAGEPDEHTFFQPVDHAARKP
ncbi:MAG: hypothetical protein GX174_07940 [Lentisphaerae bacterium]|jgi:hypothetical protein|nr:hypothetical protein [Lentisphaerota bacterium]